jgi:flagellar motor switch protein FliM
MRERLKETSLELRVDLGQTQLSIRDLLNLKEGDILVLDKPFHAPLIGSIEDTPKFQGYAGRSRNRKVYKIEEALSRAA